jgi:filamentous hemagglutinin family protein
LAIATTTKNYALAQIKPDATLGAERSVVKPNVNIKDLPSDRIDGGARRGANLFHSFQEFNIDQGRGAYFTNPVGIENILSRVTGSNRSDIQGTLGVLGNANLFLINPNGIIFGPNASLDVGGSFVGSTASSLNFADGTQFSAAVPQTTPLLTVSVPIGLQFGGTTGEIRVQGAGIPPDVTQVTQSFDDPVLEVPSGETLALVGGDVQLVGGTLQAPGGRVELGGLAGVGTVELNENGSLSFPESVTRGDVSLKDRAGVNVLAGGGGSIAINAQNLDISEGLGGLFAGIGLGLGAPGSQAGDVTLNATAAITIGQSGSIENNVNLDAIGDSGNIEIQAGSFSLSDYAQLVAGNFGRGDSGNISVQATGSVSLENNSNIFSGVSFGNNSNASSQVLSEAKGNGGNINIQAGSLSLTNAGLLTSTFGRGDAGNVSVRASNKVSFGKDSQIFSTVQPGAIGNAGSINIQAESLSLDTALFSSSTGGEGNAGGIVVQTKNAVSLANSSLIQSIVGTGAVGNGGKIDIQARSLSLINGSQLQGFVDERGDFGELKNLPGGQGRGGNIQVNASDFVYLSGVNAKSERPSGFNTRTSEGAIGRAGDIIVSTGTFRIGDGALVNAQTFNPSSGGDINITTGLLSVTNGGELSASSKGTGAAGNLEVEAGSIRLDNRALLSSDTTAGQGNINLRSEDLVLRRGSNITTNATGTATGGNITIDTGVLAALENSDISANAQAASGGQVQIKAQGLFGTGFRDQLTPESDITATSNLGPEFSGTVDITTPDVDPSQGLVALPEEVVDASGLIAQGCPAGEGPTASRFVVTGRGGLPPNPDEALSSDAVVTGLVTLDSQAETRSGAVSSKPSKSIPATLKPAKGWVMNDKGEVTLTAQVPTSVACDTP